MIPQPAITVNGTPQPIEHPLTLEQLIQSLGLAGQPVVAELNEQPVLPRDYAATIVEPGARIEIVTLAAGG